MEENRFQIIAQSYEAAMRNFPNARTDADWLLENIELQKTDRLLEISGGSGYLTKKILPRISKGSLIVQDVSQEMLRINKDKNGNDLLYYLEQDPDLPKIKKGSIDKVISLGGWHHIQDQISIMRGIYRVLKKAGIFCVGDFADDSPVQRYFDEVIHEITPTGHAGLFMSKSRMTNLGRLSGFSTEVHEIEVPFYFNNEEEVGCFFQMVHSLEQNPKETYRDIEQYFQIERAEKLAVMMNYVYVKYVK